MLITRGSQHVRPVSISRKADSALSSPTLIDDLARSRLRRRPAGSRLAARRRPRTRHTARARARRHSAHVYNSAVATAARTSRLTARSSRSDAARRGTRTSVTSTDRAGHDRRYALDASKLHAPRLATRSQLRRRPPRNGRMVPRQRSVVAPDQVGRISRVLQNAVRLKTGRMKGDHSRRRTGIATASADQGHEQASAADLRQADDLLSARDAMRGRASTRS